MKLPPVLSNPGDIYKKTSELLNYCLKNQQIGIEVDAKPIARFLETAYHEPKLSLKWSIVDFHEILTAL